MSSEKANVLLAHPGTQHAPRLAGQLYRHELLNEFWTGFAVAKQGFASRFAQALGGERFLGRLGNRLIDSIPPKKIRNTPWLEISTVLKLRKSEDKLSLLHRRNERFQAKIASKSIDNANAIVAFDTSARVLFERCKDRSKPLILDRSIAHPAQWFETQTRLQEEFPQWVSKPEPRPNFLRETEEIEHDMADLVVVGGEFAKETLVNEGLDAEKIQVNPYGVDFDRFSQMPRSATGNRPMRYLFLGSVTARKGIPLLLDAWKQIGWKKNVAELWIAGPCSDSIRALIPQIEGVNVLGKINRTKVPNLLSECDVFVLPSYSEGFGLVLLEAVAAGLPVLTTYNTGGREVVQQDVFGRLFSAGDLDALVEHLRYYRDCPPRREEIMFAAESLRDYFSWNAYGDRWKELLTGLNFACNSD